MFAIAAARTLNNMMHSGHLLKLGGQHRAWRRRWFMLHGGVLYYFKTLPEFAPIKTIDLNTAKLEGLSASRELRLITPQRTFLLRAPSAEAAMQWRVAFGEDRDTRSALMGHMEKRGSFNTDFKQRWFVLDPVLNTIAYFADAPEFAPIGAISLDSIVAPPHLAIEGSQQREHCFLLETEARVYVLCAQSQVEARHWVDELRAACESHGTEQAARPQQQEQGGGGHTFAPTSFRPSLRLPRTSVYDNGNGQWSDDEPEECVDSHQRRNAAEPEAAAASGGTATSERRAAPAASRP